MTVGTETEVIASENQIGEEIQRKGRKAWPWVLAYGLILVFAALITLFNPVVAGVATGLMLGVVLVIYGAVSVFAGWSSMSHRARWVEVVLGLLALLMGLYIVFNPIAGAMGLVKLIGAWLLVAGIFELFFAFKARHDRGWRIFLGLLDVALGAILLFSGIAAGLTFLAIVVAVSLAMRGIFLLVLAFSLRKVRFF